MVTGNPIYPEEREEVIPKKKSELEVPGPADKASSKRSSAKRRVKRSNHRSNQSRKTNSDSRADRSVMLLPGLVAK